MSVLIKGMDMPKCCDDCPLGSWTDASYFHCSLMEFEYIILHGETLENCPLVSVPTPHGRLVDADEITKDMNTFQDSFVINVSGGRFGEISCTAKTIVESED